MFSYSKSLRSIEPNDIVSINKIISQYKIKYEELNKILKGRSNFKTIYWYIDMDPIWNILRKSKAVTNDILKPKTNIHWVVFLNMLGVLIYYKDYVNSNFGVDVSMKMIFSDISPDYKANDILKEVYPDFRMKVAKTDSPELIASKQAMTVCKDMLKTFIGTCSSAVYVEETHGDPMILPYAYSKSVKKKDDHISVVISTDRYIESYVFEPNIFPFVRTPRGILGGHSLESFYLYREGNDGSNRKTLANALLFNLFQAIFGNGYRNIPKLSYLSRLETLYFLEDILLYSAIDDIKFEKMDELKILNGEFHLPRIDKVKIIPEKAFEHVKLFNLESMSNLCMEDISSIHQLGDESKKREYIGQIQALRFRPAIVEHINIDLNDEKLGSL